MRPSSSCRYGTTRQNWGALAMKPPEEEGLGLTNVELAPFNVVEALAVWDLDHESAFRHWCELPFWP
jgi:hypothetical protein